MLDVQGVRRPGTADQEVIGFIGLQLRKEAWAAVN